jgi:hypothetical protein
MTMVISTISPPFFFIKGETIHGQEHAGCLSLLASFSPNHLSLYLYCKPRAKASRQQVVCSSHPGHNI